MTHLLAAAALVIQITNVSGAPPAIVEAAQHEVTRLYAEFGVPLEWSESQPSIRIILLPYETGDLRLSEKQVMGASVRTAGGNLVDYAFYHRVRDLAHRYDVSTEQVLACAIAHELGHLLLPLRGHSADGLMRACWSRSEFQRAEQGQLKFLPDEIARIRAGLDASVEHERGDRARD
jgi:predicted Zn-dependent protease